MFLTMKNIFAGFTIYGETISQKRSGGFIASVQLARVGGNKNYKQYVWREGLCVKVASVAASQTIVAST